MPTPQWPYPKLCLAKLQPFESEMVVYFHEPRWGCVSAIDSNGRTIWIADAHRDHGQRLIVHADDKLTAFLELESLATKHAR